VSYEHNFEIVFRCTLGFKQVVLFFFSFKGYKIRLNSACVIPCRHRLRVFENRVLRRTYGPKRDEVTGEIGENCMMRSFTNCTPH
jgi:hypothetical protein